MSKSPKVADAFEDIAAQLRLEESDQQSLLDASMRDPLPGCPLIVGDEEVEPGAWRGLGLADPVTSLPPNCPITPLGVEGETCYVLNTLGYVATLKASASGKGPIGMLFAGRSRYLEWAWPRFGKKDRSTGSMEVKGWEADEARQAIQDACAIKGVFEDVDRVRGRGAWRDEVGGLIYHAGKKVFVNGRWVNPGEHGDWVFPARAGIMMPSERPGRPEAAKDLLEQLESWNWTRGELDARLLLGWVCAAMIGGALSWRPMVFLTGDFGTGKSTLQLLIRAVLGRTILDCVDASGPSLYQTLKHDTLPVAVDELEAEADTRKADQVIKLVRTAASGGKIRRGSSEGIAREYECRSAFLLSAINHPPLQAQDESRLAVLALRPIRRATADDLFEGFDALSTGREILRRMIDGWPRWEKTLKAFRAALIEAGHSSRSADQFGPMITAGHIAMSDEPPDAGELRRWTDWLQPSALAKPTENWRQVINHLMDVQPEVFRTYAKKHLAGYIEDWRTTDSNGMGASELKVLEDRCADMGLAITFAKGMPRVWENARLFVPASHPTVIRLFSGTQWAGRPGAGGVWHSALKLGPVDTCWEGVCGKGLDRDRKGVNVLLSAVFGPEPDEDALDAA